LSLRLFYLFVCSFVCLFVSGYLYAVSNTGTQLWALSAGPGYQAGTKNAPVIGADSTVYMVSSLFSLTAVH
jgi:outer membrane protein assembly factor BamB